MILMRTLCTRVQISQTVTNPSKKALHDVHFGFALPVNVTLLAWKLRPRDQNKPAMRAILRGKDASKYRTVTVVNGEPSA